MKKDTQAQIRDLEKRIAELQARRDMLGKEHHELSIAIDERAAMLGGDMLAGRNPAAKIEAQTRDRVKAEGLLSAMQQADMQLRDLRTELLGLRRDVVTDEVDSIQAQIKSLADELAATACEMYQKAGNAIEMQNQIRVIIQEYSNILEPDVKIRWEQYKPFGQCTRIRGSLDPLVRALDIANKAGRYLS